VKAIAIIPARGGSKRIPKKNIKPFHGKPLIAYSIETALESKLFSKVVVTTDDKEIAKVAKEYGADVPFVRPPELSDDYTGTTDVIKHAIEFLRKSGEEFDYVCTIYATAPLLQSKYLVEGFEKIKSNDIGMVFSATSMPFPIQRTFKVVDGKCEMFTPNHYYSRSQDLEEAYQDAGQFYWEKRDRELRDIAFGKDSMPVILPRHLVQDIDTIEDWQRAEYMYEVANRDKFDDWNKIKKRLDNKKELISFYQGNIYFISIGKNIGYESLGKQELFLRPVLVYKKLSKSTFLGIPLTSKEKKGSYYFSFNYKKGITSTAMLNQMRVFDIRRSEYLSGKINKNTYKNLEKKVNEFMNVTLSKKRGNANEG
jgi:pseudaminic acid cytidylyltransferase